MSAFKACSLAFVFTSMVAGSAFAGDHEWTVRKASGEVWTGAQGVQPVSLGAEAVLKPGDTVTTGRNGRVLLARGQETILIAPNSVVDIPAEKKQGLATTIAQRAGSILLDVEKKNVSHFEVETPYLAAVVKGTQFRVTVGPTGTRVEVVRGQVQVVDFKTGQIGQVLPGQAAQSFAHGSNGLSLTGAGTFKPIENGTPRASTLEQVKVPKSGIKAPQNLNRQGLRAAQARPAPSRGLGKAAGHDARARVGVQRPGVIRISAPIGDVRLNFRKVTQGLARSTSATADAGRRSSVKETTIWNSPDGKSGMGAAATARGDGNGNGNGNGASGAGNGSSAARAAVAAGARGNGNSNANAGGNGNGNARGNGNGNAGGNGNGNAGGNGNGNAGGNGNGNAGGNGNGNAGGNGNGNAGGNGNGNAGGNGNGNAGGNGNGNAGGNGNGNAGGNGNGNAGGNGNGNAGGNGNGNGRVRL